MKTSGFERVGFSQEKLHHALRQMCPAALKGYTKEVTQQMRSEWSPMNPTRFCCYFVSEMVYRFCLPDSYPMALVISGETSLHRFLICADRTIVDLTCDQFPFWLDYAEAKSKGFMQTGGPGPSKRAVALAKLLLKP